MWGVARRDTPPIVFASVRKAMKAKELDGISSARFVTSVRKRKKTQDLLLRN
jgi:hypothetical protein